MEYLVKITIIRHESLFTLTINFRRRGIILSPPHLEVSPITNMKTQLFFAGTLLILLPSYAIGTCTNTWRKKVGKVICTNINQDEYLTNLFEMRTNFTDIIENKNITKLSITIANSYFLSIDEWIYLPWINLLAKITILKVTNSSVTNIKSLHKFQSLDTLDLSKNNITDFSFLTELKKLRSLHLRQSTFSKDSSLFTYLQKYQSSLKLVDLSQSNLNELSLFYNIEKYDLSENSHLTSITFNQSFPVRYLNLSGNNQLESFRIIGKNDFLCIYSINLSHLNNSFNFSLLKNIKIYNEILLSNNNIQILNESVFSISNLISRKCFSEPGISIDLSNVHLKHISSNYFSSQIFNLINLSYNDLGNLEDSIFSQSEIILLDLSNSNISTIGPNVFNYTCVKLLNLSSNNIISLEEVFDNIEIIIELDLSFNPIQTLSHNTFKKCRYLEILNLANTRVILLGENVFSNLVSLRKLTLSFIGSINITSIKNMYVTELTICSSSLINLGPENFKGFYMLSKLNFLNTSVSNVSSFSFKGLSMLKILNIQELNRSSRDISIFKNLPNLQHLDLSNHNIKSIVSEFEGLYSLKSLNLSRNIITDIGVEAFVFLKKLEVLSLAHNQLSIIPVGIFAYLQKLTHLYLNHNSLQKLLPGIFSGLNNLILLDISQNQLLRTKPHILLTNTLPNLKYLYVQNNNLGNEYAANDNTLRRYEFGLIANQASLEYIDINNNEWSCATLIDVLCSFKNKNITYRPTNPQYTQTNINGVSCKP